MKECKDSLCPKRAISCSEYCGEHTENNGWLKCILSFLDKKDKFDDLYISEVEIENSVIIKDRIFTFCEINDCKFEAVKFLNCEFINCDFISVEFEEVELYECKLSQCSFDDSFFSGASILTCQFEETDFSNCTFHDDTKIIKSKFEICKLANVDFYNINSLKETIFNQCVLSKSTFNDSCLDYVTFQYSEFSKCTLIYSSLRFSTFKGIDQDFKFHEPPMACDFYKCNIDHTLKSILEPFYNNFDEKNVDIYYLTSINKLVALNHPNYLTHLTYFLIKYGNSHNIYKLKPTIINTYKKYYQLAIDTNNVGTAGNIINEYAHLPSEIQDNLLQLSSPDTYKVEGAYIVLYLSPRNNNNFATVEKINFLLSKLCITTDNKDRLEIISIRKGSIIETVYGELPNILVFAGTLYAASKATLSIIKQGLEIRKLFAETKKIEFENKQLFDKTTDSLEDDSHKKKMHYFIQSIDNIEITSKANYTLVAGRLTKISKSEEYLKIVKELDENYTIDRIEIRNESNQ